MLALFKFRRSATAKHRASKISGPRATLGASNIPGRSISPCPHVRLALFRKTRAGRRPRFVFHRCGPSHSLTSPALLIDDALVRHNLHALWTIAVLMVVVTIAGFALNICSSYLYVRFSAECLFDMRLAVYRHLQKLSPRFFRQEQARRPRLPQLTTTLVKSSVSVPTPCSLFSPTFCSSPAASPS